MEIKIDKITTKSTPDKCFVHARGDIDDKGRIIITTQPLRVSGCDVFYQMHKIISYDRGETWSEITPCKNLDRRPFGENMEYCISDATPLFHEKTKTFIGTGHSVIYKDDNLAPDPRKGHILYMVYDEKENDWSDFKILEIPGLDEDKFFSIGSGCCQCLELEDGDMLIPVYARSYEVSLDPWNGNSQACVIRCGFDGKELTFKEMGNLLDVEQPRGLGEPSIIRHGDMYYMCIRNDVSGYVSKSSDGLHYEDPIEICFENGENIGNYNTQQHWIRGKDKLYLVYTRRAGINDHIFRHRAPLFMAEFDTERMCVIADTEVIVVPERGARLGNFGCFNASDDEAYVIAAEWMQNDPDGWEKCAQYGSDNSIFVTKIKF